MQYDIIIVTYNSEKWLANCVNAICSACFAKEKLRLVFVDNNSTDGTVALLTQLQGNTELGGFEIIKMQKNKGFATGCNEGAKKCSGDILFFLNADTAVLPNVFAQLDTAFALHSDAGAIECRQLPYELGHHFNPITLETQWASGTALAVKREAFEKIGGFDKRFFMCCEDVDLSWRLRGEGYKLYNAPKAAVNHYTIDSHNDETAKLREYAFTHLGNLCLAFKYGSFAQLFKAICMYINEMRHPTHFANVRRVMLKNLWKFCFGFLPFLCWRIGHNRKNIPYMENGKYAPERGKFLLEPLPEVTPMISVIVRTCNRSHTLRETLTTLRHQTYDNFEIVIIEDGANISQGMIETQFSDLPINYIATNINQGRGKAGNLGLSMAKGEYCNFLDDDDYFYPDHLEIMAAKALQHPEADLILGCAMVMKKHTVSTVPYVYEIKELYSMRYDRLDLFTMCQSCQIPIQSAMFKKELFTKYGGLREDIDGNEDWSMWMNFFAKGAKRIDPLHVDISRETSIFVLDADERLAQQRLDNYKEYNEAFYNDKSLEFTVSLAQMREFQRGTLVYFEHVYKTGQTEKYIEDTKRRLNN